ncbi:E3 ubiquitin-protein ligase MIB2-like isoform X2 [Octopus sinensis]|uniref:E3 ubiquitin-protein ligase MIB2-like isoform X2 n=1 Tax=Octopus sinensis TaxID=2607531 RepID=A0A7E6FTE6_9MOLL|nr:E3 ubiquitin-protein ligase MIB2-like isoform X2 [Octopus sinensis]
MTPFLQAVSSGNFRIMQEFISKGADVNVVDDIGNNCLHLAVRKEEFHSEDESLTVFDKYYKKLQLSKGGKPSGLAVACYLADNGSNFYHRNEQNVMPLDLIKDTNLKEKIKRLFPPPVKVFTENVTIDQCLLCKSSEATVTFQPCEHTVTCKDCCSENEPKNCPKCQQVIVDKRGFGRELGVPQTELDFIINDYPKNTKEQIFQMLHYWFKGCDSKKHPFETLRNALKSRHCKEALTYLDSVNSHGNV